MNIQKRLYWLKKFEAFMLLMGILGPFATAPQIVKLYHTHTHHAAGLSLSSWLAYLLLSALWCGYGLIHKNAPIWVGNLIGFAMNTLMVIGIIFHVGVTF